MKEKKIYHEIPAGRNNFHSAILTTYSFNFHHFEYQILKTLKQKSIYNIGVLVDANMLDNTLGISSAGLKQLTQTYSINGIHSVGAFHPKMNFLIGDNHLMLILGSGNITAGGHGKNHETFSNLYANSIDSPLIPLLNEAWFYIQNISSNLEGYSRHRIEKKIPRNCSLIKPLIEKPHEFYRIDNDIELALIYNDDTSIINQITLLIPGKSINSITIVCPYYDEDGALLLSLLEEFPKAILNVFLPFEHGLPPTKLFDNDRISFFQWEKTTRGQKTINASEGYYRKLHSKLFFFQSGAIEYCMLGSANATIAAFGTKNKRGKNDEFGLLYKSSSIDFLTELGITGKKIITHPNQLKRETWVVNSESISNNIHKSIKIDSCDLDGNTITCFCQFNNKFENVYLYIFNDLGDEIIKSRTKVLLETKISIRLTNDIFQNNLAYILFKDDNNNIISNKQVINNISSLFNTDPSKENRAVRSLRAALEIGKINEYQLLGYLNDLNDKDSKKRAVQSNSNKFTDEEKADAHSEMTFEEAMKASKNKKHNIQLSTKHNSIQFWQSISSSLKEKKEKVSDDLNDEEEDAVATDSNNRKNPESESEDFEVKDDAELRRILSKTQQFAKSFVGSMNKLARDKEYEINEVALCQFLLVSHITTVIHHYNTYDLPYDEKLKKYKVYTPGQWKEILNGQYFTLMQNILIAFSKMMLSHSITNMDDDEYRKKNFKSYIQEVVSYIFIYNYLINKNGQENPHSEMTDLACLNIINKLGFPSDDFIELIETISKSKSEVLFNTIGVIQLKNRIEKLFNKIESKDGVFKHKYDAYGVCLIKKNDNKTISFKSIFDEHQIFKINIKDWSKL